MFQRASWIVLFGVALASCDDASTTSSAGGSTATSGASTSSSNGTSTTTGSSSTASSTGSASTGMTSSSSGTAGPCAEGTLFYQTDFGADGAWPQPWSEAGGVETAIIVGGRARLVPLHASYPLARMKLPATLVNSESTFSIELENAPAQGMGFYVRQNGGYLAQTNPDGAGYAVFTAGVLNPPGVGSWFEAEGTGEVQLAQSAFPLQSNTTYRLRVRVENESMSSTRIRARIWEDGTSEPSAWTHDHTDATRPELQGLPGGFAIDAWHNPGSGGFEDVWIDDLTICQL